MHQFTVFTPTHNRAHLLPQLYECLKRQTYKDFLWLVIDDGSVDNTKEVVEGFINDKILDVEYHFIENGYKHKAYKLSSELVKTPYYIDIDDDDELVDNCLEVFKNEWDKIDDESIGEIRALSIDDNDKVVGNCKPEIGKKFVSTYLNEHYLKGRCLENLTCRKSVYLRNLFDINDDWLYDNVTYVTECIFWYRTSRKYKTLYYNIPLRLYHLQDDSMSNNKLKSDTFYYNALFASYHVLNETRDYFFAKTLSSVKEIIRYGAYGHILHFSYRKMSFQLNSTMFKILFYLLCPMSYCYSKIIRR